MTIAPQDFAPIDTLAGGGQMGELIRNLDWSRTPLGPIQSWPQSLKTSVSICLNSRFPVLIWWGPQLVKIYNDAYVELIGSKHPAALGSPGREVWPEIWDTIGPLLQGVMERGEASWADDLLLMLERNGFPEECYFTFSYSPIRDESGGIGGVFTPVIETTEKVLQERRLRALRDLATVRNLVSASSEDVCRRAVELLAADTADLPFLALYLCGDPPQTATLAASSLLSEHNFALPTSLDLREPGWLPATPFSGQPLGGQLPAVLSLDSLNLPQPLLGPHGSFVRETVLLPIRGQTTPIGFLLAGISPRKRLDARYHAFYAQIAEELTEALRASRMVQREAELLAEAEAERLKLRELFLQAPAGMMMLQGPYHQIALVNEKYVRLIGRQSQADLLGKPLAVALPEVVDQGFIDLLDTVFRCGSPFWGNEVKVTLDREESHQPKDGYFNFVYQPTRNAAGQIEGILVHVVEVTEQVLARHEIESREQQFRVLADSIPQLCWMANAEGDLFWYNRRWYEYTGTTPDEMRGWGWQSVHDPAQLPLVLERYRHSLASGEPFNMTFPLRGADGNFRPFLTLALPVRDASGQIIRWFGTNTDMEAQLKTEEALRRSEKLAAVGRLASSIAHEINNPLEAVTNLIFLAKVAASPGEAHAFLESAESELSRVAQITTQTLRFHKQLTAPVPTDVAELADSILALYRTRLAHNGIELTFESHPSPPLLCYDGEIRQVLANLIANAIDAMPHGGKLRIRVRAASAARPCAPALRITVADTGHGIEPETQKRLYEPFFTTKENLGTGLGLWVSAGIVEKHRGVLHTRSRTASPSGTVFVVEFPYVPCNPEDPNNLPDDTAAVSAV